MNSTRQKTSRLQQPKVRGQDNPMLGRRKSHGAKSNLTRLQGPSYAYRLSVSVMRSVPCNTTSPAQLGQPPGLPHGAVMITLADLPAEDIPPSHYKNPFRAGGPVAFPICPLDYKVTSPTSPPSPCSLLSTQLRPWKQPPICSP